MSGEKKVEKKTSIEKERKRKERKRITASLKGRYVKNKENYRKTNKQKKKISLIEETEATIRKKNIREKREKKKVKENEIRK